MGQTTRKLADEVTGELEYRYDRSDLFADTWDQPATLTYADVVLTAAGSLVVTSAAHLDAPYQPPRVLRPEDLPKGARIVTWPWFAEGFREAGYTDIALRG